MQPVKLSLGSKLFEGKDQMIQENVGVCSTFRFHTHDDYYEFFYVTRGRALHLVNGASQVISRGSLVFVRPRDEHAYDYYRQDDFVFYNAGINLKHFARVMDYFGVDASYFDTPRLPLHVHLEGEDAEHLVALLARLKEMPDGHDRQCLFNLVVANVVFFMLSCPCIVNSEAFPSWLMALIHEMDKPENFTAGLPRLLKLANYSQSYINRVFRQYLFTTPTQYINDLRIHYAHKLITSTNQTILEISSLCGFNSISYFYRVFKSKYGFCPNDLRLKD